MGAVVPFVLKGWAALLAFTNHPSILRTNSYDLVTSNVYVRTFDITGSPGQTNDYKFYIETGGNWESVPQASSTRLMAIDS